MALAKIRDLANTKVGFSQVSYVANKYYKSILKNAFDILHNVILAETQKYYC